ncbi:hypothetical protein KY306_02450, partial [Candidatus Woesearchaeota archaeon]|nr:hypothetical protein [Candidatus Woesearchaeota archaeon]
RGGCTVRYSCESTWGECEKANGYSLQERLCHQTCGYPDFTERKGCLPSGCYSADDCGRVAWFDCIGGECVAKECVTDDDCAPYFECVDGTCEPVGILEIEEIPIEMPGRISFLKEESVLFPTTDEIRGYYTHKINIKEMVNFFPVYNLFYEPTTTPLAAIVKESDWITKAFAAFTAFLLFLLIAYLITRERKYVPPETE